MSLLRTGLNKCFGLKHYPYGKHTICKRKADDTLWLASHGDYGESMVALFTGKNTFYFRRVHKVGRRLVVNHSRVWEFSEGGLFDIIGDKLVYQLRRQAHAIKP